MAFGIEDVERIVVSFFKTECIQVYCSRNLGVLATDIHDKAVVDEHPYVIVTEEFEVLARNIFERGLDLHGESIVVSLSTARNIVKVGIRYGPFGIKVLEVFK